MITKATDLEKLPTEVRDKIRAICNQDPTDGALVVLANDLGIEELLPEGRVADVFRIWLKVLGYIRVKDSDSGDVPVIAWVDIQAESFLEGNPNQEDKGKEILSTLEIRLSVLADMFTKTNDLAEKVKEKITSEQPSD